MGASPRTFGAVKSYEIADDGTLVLDVLGVVFSNDDSGEENVARDLQGQYFLPPDQTNYHLGDDESSWLYPGKRVPVLYDHGLDEYVGDVVVGEAVFKGVTNEGLRFLIEITERRAKQYRKFVEELAKRGLLGVSSQTLISMFRAMKSGRITGWGVAELSITPTPADPRTIAAVKQVAKMCNVDMEGKNMAKQDQVVPEETAVVDADPTPDKVEVAEDTTTQREEGTVAKAVSQVLDKVEAEAEAVAANTAYAELLKRIGTLEQALQELTGTVKALADTQKESENRSEEQMKALTDDIGAALAKFAEKFGSVMTKHIAADVVERAAVMSVNEADAISGVAKRSGNTSQILQWPGADTYMGRPIK